MTQRKWSTYQENIFNWVNGSEKNLVVEAVAGSGKTTTGVEIFNRLPKEGKSVFCAFNKHIATELQERLGEHGTALTYHALGFKMVRNALGNVKVNAYKNDNLLKAKYGKNRYDIFSPAKQLTSLFKANNESYDFSTAQDYIFYYGIDMGEDDAVTPDILDAVEYLLDPRHCYKGEIDFDDMCWLPVVNNLPAEKNDFLVVDEVQDTSAIQLHLALKTLNGHSRMIGIGDRNQSIYGWRGADTNAIPNLIDVLKANTLPLSITYRNPLKIVQLVNERFPNISFLARDNAPDGIIEDVSFHNAKNLFKPGDLVLCRLNALMVAPVMELISQGKKAIIKGKDIGKNLVTLVKKVSKLYSPTSIYEFLHNLTEYGVIEVEKLNIRGKYTQASILEDKIDTLAVLCEGANSISDLLYKIELIFSDDIEGIVFSTVHKAKGLEAENVWILNPELIPFKRATLDWQKIQEQNIAYVAYTRSLNSLRFIC